MGSWFWLNVPLGLLFFGCWAGIPLWLVVTRWHRETEAKHAEIAARAAAVPILVPERALASTGDETVTPAYARVPSPPR
jgi:hypothetical protein